MVDTGNVTEQLVEKLKHHIEEAQKIYRTLETIKDITGISIEMPNMSLLKSHSGKGSTGRAKKLTIKPDQFFGKSNTEAAEEYLRMVNHATSLKDIYEALSKGGIIFSGKDPQKSLYTQIVRATRKFVKIGKGSNVNFGLIDFYPDRVKKKIKEKEASALDNNKPENNEGSEETEISKKTEEPLF